MDGSGNTEASPKLAGQILNNSELYVRNISYKDQYAFLMVFLLTLTHLHPDTEKTKLTCGALHKWWSDLDTKARKAVKFVCQFIKSNDDIIHLCSGIGVSPKGSELACAIGEKISAQKYSFKGIKNVIMDLPILDRITDQNIGRIEEGPLPNPKKPDSETLKEYFDCNNVPHNVRGNLVAKFKLEITRATHRHNRICESGDLNLTTQQISTIVADSTLSRLHARYKKLLESVELPPGGFVRKEQARAAAILSTTYQNLRERQIETGLEPSPKDWRVAEAERLRASFYREQKRQQRPKPKSQKRPAKTATLA
jgi:hypothetical protein